MKKITIITATLNSANKISTLINSLKKQSNKNFNWIVKDGGSVDSTLLKLSEIKKDISLKIIKGKDKGIYDALNLAINKCKTEYYLVIGSDDILNSNAIDNFYKLIDDSTSYDIIASSWIVDNKVNHPKKNFGWLYGMLGLSSCHSVATLIKKSLHDKYGNYSLNFPICADQLFIKNAVYGNCKIYRSNFVSGIFFKGGNSSQNTLQFLTEQFKVQLLTEKFQFFQLIIFVLRLLKHYRKLI